MQDTLTSKTTSPTLPPIPRPSLLNGRTVWALIFIGSIIWALAQTRLFRDELINTGGWTVIARFITASLHPTLTSDFLWLTLDATLTTLAFAICGAVSSLVIGFGVGILASEVWWESVMPRQSRFRWFKSHRAPWLIVRSILAFFRAIHEIIWGLFFVNIIGLDPLTAILAIAIPFGAITAKVFSEILDETPRQPLIALQNSGVSPLKAFAYTLIPQAFPDWVSYGFYRFECSIRAAAVLGIIGAGGLGYEIFLSLQTLKYEQIWTLFYALFLLNGIADFWSGLLRRRLGSGVSRITGAGLEAGDVEPVSPRPPVRPNDPVIRGSLIAMALLILFAFWYVQPDLGRLFSAQAIEHFRFIGARVFPLNFGAFSLAEWYRLASITMSMSLLAVAGAGIVGLLLSYPAANNFLLPGGLLDSGGQSGLRRLLGWTILLLTRAMLLVTRSIPPPIWALLLLFVLFPGIIPGAVALGLYTLGVLGRLMAEVVENIDERPLRALKALGSDGGQIFTYGVLPPTFPRFISYMLYRWEETIRATVVIGLVGAGGLGRVLTEQLIGFNYQGVLTTLIVFVGLTFLVDLISAIARRAFREG